MFNGKNRHLVNEKMMKKGQMPNYLLEMVNGQCRPLIKAGLYGNKSRNYHSAQRRQPRRALCSAISDKIKADQRQKAHKRESPGIGAR